MTMSMKKFMFFLVAAFICSTASAQLVTSTTITKKRTKAVWYLKAGMNIANISGDGVDASSIAGYNVGIMFDRPFGNSGAFWGMGLQLATKGFKIEEEISGAEASTKYFANKLEIPLNFGYKFQINDDLAVDARVGGFANYDVFGKVKSTVKYQGNEDTQSISLGDAVDAGDRFGAGIQFGVGVWYQHLNFNITYQKGLVDQFDGAKENNWMLSLGYAF